MQQDISVQRASRLEQTFFEALHAQLPCAEMQNLRLFTRNASTEAQNCSDAEGLIKLILYSRTHHLNAGKLSSTCTMSHLDILSQTSHYVSELH